ncbi:hypothetical protein [Agromyces sp. GXQ0307]|uniref:hypothetical protein n=1 Tax=Agromyces sp. GXQ0307 TaxID=3377835 RepID=UPI00383BBE35
MRPPHARRTFAVFESDERGPIMEIRKHIAVAALAAGAIGVLGGCAAQGTAFDDTARAASAEQRAAAADVRDAASAQGDRLAAYADASAVASDGTGASAAQGERLSAFAAALGGSTSSSHQQGERLARLAEAMAASGTTDGR